MLLQVHQYFCGGPTYPHRKRRSIDDIRDNGSLLRTALRSQARRHECRAERATPYAGSIGKKLL